MKTRAIVQKVVNRYLKAGEVHYHGSRHRFSVLKAENWVTPYKRDALVFAVPWDSRELKYTGGPGGRPPQMLDFKPNVFLEDHPIYLYEIRGNVVPALTNTGRNYAWNRKVTQDTRVKLIETIPSWKDLLT
jgi:hypothetical protein